jgi:hypothetical protein
LGEIRRGERQRYRDTEIQRHRNKDHRDRADN